MKIYIIQGPQGCGKSHLSRQITYNKNFIETDLINKKTSIGNILRNNSSQKEKIDFIVFEGITDQKSLRDFLFESSIEESIQIRFPYSMEFTSVKIPDFIITTQLPIDTDQFRSNRFEMVDIKFWK